MLGELPFAWPVLLPLLLDMCFVLYKYPESKLVLIQSPSSIGSGRSALPRAETLQDDLNVNDQEASLDLQGMHINRLQRNPLHLELSVA